MEFLRAFTYILKDRHWLIKLAEMALFVVLIPVPVIGLFCLCALLGYLAEIIHNVSSDYPRPLPEWNHIGEDIGKGAPVLVAVALYHLPLVFVVGLLFVARETLAVSLFGSLTFAGVLVTIMPLLMIYCAVAWSLLAIGLVYYAESWDGGVFYQLGKLTRGISRHSVLTLQWLVSCLAASMVLLILLPLAPFLFIPVQGYLTGVFGRRLFAARMAFRDANTDAAPDAERHAFGFATPEAHAPLRGSETA